MFVQVHCGALNQSTDSTQLQSHSTTSHALFYAVFTAGASLFSHCLYAGKWSAARVPLGFEHIETTGFIQYPFNLRLNQMYIVAYGPFKKFTESIFFNVAKPNNTVDKAKYKYS